MEFASSTSDWIFEEILQQIKQKYTKESIDSSWATEEVAINEALKAIERHLNQTKRYYYKKILGVGGSGIVLHLGDRMFPKIDKALKLPRPVEGKVKLLTEMLKKEISYLAELQHPGIVKIVYYEIIENIQYYGNLPFYLMEYIGRRLILCT